MTNLSSPPVQRLNYKARYNSYDYSYFDNYPALNVDKTINIPIDYYQTMGVPVSYLDYHSPGLFEILGYVDRPFLSGKVIYKRILIKRK